MSSVYHASHSLFFNIALNLTSSSSTIRARLRWRQRRRAVAVADILADILRMAMALSRRRCRSWVFFALKREDGLQRVPRVRVLRIMTEGCAAARQRCNKDGERPKLDGGRRRGSLGPGIGGIEWSK
jgi:hypothetical protein